MEEGNNECSFLKPIGEKCKRPAIRGENYSGDGANYCYSHHPDYAEERRANASKGGRPGGPLPANRELSRIAKRLERMADNVIAGSLSQSKALAAGRLLNAARAALSASVRAKGAERLEEELEELKRIVYGDRYGGDYAGLGGYDDDQL